MKRKVFALSAVAALAITFGAKADNWNLRFGLITNNDYDNPVWITVYDLAKTAHLDYGCMEAKNFRTWTSGNYLYGSFYYVRGEVKAEPNCQGATLCDTIVQVNPQNGRIARDFLKSVNAKGYGVLAHVAAELVPKDVTGTVVSIKPNGSNCFWEHEN
jgi:hypothetical protein